MSDMEASMEASSCGGSGTSEGGMQTAGSGTTSPVTDLLSIMNKSDDDDAADAALRKQSTKTVKSSVPTLNVPLTRSVQPTSSLSSDAVLSFVKSKHSHLSLLSSFISSSSYLLPSRFQDDDTTVEITCALADFVSLFNDAVYYCHGESGHSTAGDGMSIGDRGSQPRRFGNVATRDVLILRACIAGLECVELAAEKVAAKRGGGTRGKVVATIEAAKAACRILLIMAAGGDGILQRGGGLEPGVRQAKEGEVRLREGVYFGVQEKGRRTGLMIGTPNQALVRGYMEKVNEKAEEVVVDKLDTIQKEIDETFSPNKGGSRAMVIAGEILHILRPVVTTAMSNRLGGSRGGVVPWATGLIMDVTSHKLSYAGLSGLQPKSTGGNFAPNNPNMQELKRRKMRWLLYLLRSPIWEHLTGKVVERAGRLPIPGGKRILAYLLQWVLYIRKHHFMLESGLG